ncbi:MAG: hypothetical protein AB7P21_20190 [Lautropia sp.]
MISIRSYVAAAAAVSTLAAGTVHAANPVAGAVVGAGAGALVGQALGGRDAAIVGSAIGAIAGAGIAQASQGRGAMMIVAPAVPVRVHDRGPGYIVGPYPPPPRHRDGYWQRFQDNWGAPYWVWRDVRPVIAAPPVYAPPVYAPPVYVPAPVRVGPAYRTPPHFAHPERYFDGAAAPYRPDPRFDRDGRRGHR